MNSIFQNIIGFALTIILFIFYYFFGLAMIKRFARDLSKKLTNLEIFFISFFVGLFFQVWISFIIALLLKNIIMAQVISIFIALIFTFYHKKYLKIRIFTEIKQHRIAAIIFFLITIIFLFCVFFRFDGDTIYNARPNHGDWALHIGLINSFAKGNNIPPMYPIFPSARLGYSFLNFYANALLVNLGLDIFYAFNVFQFFLTFSLLFFIYFLGNRLFRKRTYSLLFTLISFLGGGLGLIYIFKNKLPFLSAIRSEDYYISHTLNILPINLSVNSLSQRTGLFGWICIFIVFILLFDEIFKLKKWKRIQEYPLIIILLGGLFFFHSYSFLIIMLFLFFIWVQKPAKSLTYLLISSGVLALPQLLWIKGQTTRRGFLDLMDGIVVSIRKPLSFLWMWLVNFGAILLLPLFGFRKRFRHLLLPLFGFFVIGNAIRFQPWDFDNHKLIIVCYLILSIFSVAGIKWLWELKVRNSLKLIIRSLTVLVIILILLPSFQGVYLYYKDPSLLATRKEEALGEAIGDITPVNSVILTGTQHNHPVFLFSGRKIFEGFRGWIQTHGLNIRAQDEELKAMFEVSDKEKACGLFRKNKIDYVFVSRWERRENWYEVNEDFFRNNFKIIFERSNSTLFKVEC
jgi:hypothetical protein